MANNFNYTNLFLCSDQLIDIVEILSTCATNIY